MNEKTYLRVMHSLGKDLKRAENTEPYDPDAYNKVIDAMNQTNIVFYRSHRQFSCLTRWIIFILVLLFACVVYSILS